MAKLYFYYSAMNAGKTTTLLQSAYNYAERGMRTLILTPQLDTRAERLSSSGPSGHLLPQAGEGNPARPAAADSNMGVVASRIGLRANARRFTRDDDLLAIAQADIAAHGQLDCVLVDEAQFLSKAQAWQLGDIVDALGIPVLAYGLRTDFRGELFEGSQYLLAWADNLIEIKTICHSGKKATMVVRVDEHGRAVTDGPQVELGGNDRYVSVSRAEFKKIMSGEDRVELQQSVLPLDIPRGPKP
jgi:thymidine kinase